MTFIHEPRWRGPFDCERTLADDAREGGIYPQQTEPHVHFHQHDDTPRHAHYHVHPDDHAHSTQTQVRANIDEGGI